MKKHLFFSLALMASLTASADNIALNGTTKATTGNAAEAVDGNLGTRWESAQEDPQTWQIDLGSVQTFNSIQIVWEGAWGKSFTIEAGNNVGDDGYLTGGTAIFTAEGQDLGGKAFPYTQQIDFAAPVTARYVKFIGKERGTPYGYSFWEFRVNTPSAMPAVPAVSGDDVNLLFSNGNQNGFNWYDWGGGNGTIDDVNGTAVYKISNFKYFGSQFPETDVSNKKFFHLDIYPLQDMSLSTVMICTNGNGNDGEKGIQKELKANQWNTIDIPVQDYLDKGALMTRLYQIKFVSKVVSNGEGQSGSDGFQNADGTGTFYIGNAYFHGTRVADTEIPVMVSASAGEVKSTSAELKLNATDNNNKITFIVTNKANGTTTEVTGNSGVEATANIKNLTPATEYTFEIQAKDAAGNLSAEKKTVTLTTKAQAQLSPAPTPTQNPTDVISIYSDAYPNATDGFNIGGWGQSTIAAPYNIATGDEAYSLENFNYLGFEFQKDIDASQMTRLHIDVYPMENGNFGITPITRNGSAHEKSIVKPVTAEQWNSLDIDLAEYTGAGMNLAAVFQMKFDNGNNGHYYIDNVYFYKDGSVTPPAPTHLTDAGADANGIHVLTGAWSAEEFAAIDATAKANAYDLTAVSHTEVIDVVNKTANPFALFVTPVAGTVNRNEVVKQADGTYKGFAIFFQENANDAKYADYAFDINTGIAPINVDNPFFERILTGANQYITTTVPYDYATIPNEAEGTKFYKLASVANADANVVNIVFTSVTSIEKNTPYIVLSKTGGITFANPGNVTIDWADKTTEANGYVFHNNYKAQNLASTTDTYVLKAGETEGANFISTTGTMNPFRAYITGNVPVGAKLTVLLQEPTGLQTLAGEDALNAIFNIYSIDGKLVRSNADSMLGLEKGVYIINGHKVLVK